MQPTPQNGAADAERLGSMNMVDELGFAASRYALGLLLPEDMVRLADLALSDGHYSEPIAELAEYRTDKHPSKGDVEPAFLRWLRESRVPLPSHEDAVWHLLRLAIAGIVRGKVSPLEGLVEVHQIYSQTPFPERYGLAALCAAYWVHDELESRPLDVAFRGSQGPEAIAELESHVRDLAEVWWKVYGPSPAFSLESPEAARLALVGVPFQDLRLERLVSPRASLSNPLRVALAGAIAVLIVALVWLVASI